MSPRFSQSLQYTAVFVNGHSSKQNFTKCVFEPLLIKTATISFDPTPSLNNSLHCVLCSIDPPTILVKMIICSFVLYFTENLTTLHGKQVTALLYRSYDF